MCAGESVCVCACVRVCVCDRLYCFCERETNPYLADGYACINQSLCVFALRGQKQFSADRTGSKQKDCIVPRSVYQTLPVSNVLHRVLISTQLRMQTVLQFGRRYQIICH